MPIFEILVADELIVRSILVVVTISAIHFCKHVS